MHFLTLVMRRQSVALSSATQNVISQKIVHGERSILARLYYIVLQCKAEKLLQSINK